MPEKKGLYLRILINADYTFQHLFDDIDQMKKIRSVMYDAKSNKKYPTPQEMANMLSNVSCGISGTSNGGISEKYSKVFIAMNDPKCQIYTNHLNAPEVKVVKDKDYVYFEPIQPVPKNEIGWMFGGAYIQAPEGKYGYDEIERKCFIDLIGKEKELVNLHDRKETVEQYEMLSR